MMMIEQIIIRYKPIAKWIIIIIITWIGMNILKYEIIPATDIASHHLSRFINCNIVGIISLPAEPRDRY